MNFKESPFMYALAGMVVAFVLAQSVFFLVKAWKQGRKLGLSAQTMRSTVTSSVLFSVAPAISVVATVIGTLVFSEPQTVLAALGVLLILGAVVVLNRKDRSGPAAGTEKPSEEGAEER